MKYFMPTKLYSEKNCVAAHADELCSLGTHALIVTGQNSSKVNGSLADVTAALEKNSVKYTVFDSVEENPSVETVMAARDMGLECGADFVIGIGGGSPLDASKAVALMLKNSGKDWEFMYENKTSAYLPLAAVPTTCGTGSEVTGVAVLTRHDLKTKVSMKQKVFPTLALVDGKYLTSAPRHIIVNTAIDALSHLIESAVNVNADTYSDMTVFAGLREWAKCRRYIDGSAEIDEKAAAMLMNASALAGMSIAQTGTTIPHALSYMLTYEAKIPHGAAVGAFQGKYLKYADTDRKNAVLEAAGFADTDELGHFISALAPVSAERELLERSAMAVLKNHAKLSLCPYNIDEIVMADLIQLGI
ncbi:MAG: iron-containing alcohol dehydrogenase [Ruminococcus sp.]|nr:iron-containing alcohol dehydrogenase [Ruminococcus sp.]